MTCKTSMATTPRIVCNEQSLQDTSFDSDTSVSAVVESAVCEPCLWHSMYHRPATSHSIYLESFARPLQNLPVDCPA